MIGTSLRTWKRLARTEVEVTGVGDEGKAKNSKTKKNSKRYEGDDEKRKKKPIWEGGGNESTKTILVEAVLQPRQAQ
jgi:hypothetical protein